MAPILTYTADEIVENAPAIIKGNAEDIFDMTYTPLNTIEAPFDAAYMLKARESFHESIDNLKKTKQIKSTLELKLETTSAIISAMDLIDAEDWFVISNVQIVDDCKDKDDFEVAYFELEKDRFSIRLSKATAHKCPRCWKFQAEEADCLCARCKSVVDA